MFRVDCCKLLGGKHLRFLRKKGGAQLERFLRTWDRDLSGWDGHLSGWGRRLSESARRQCCWTAYFVLVVFWSCACSCPPTMPLQFRAKSGPKFRVKTKRFREI